MFGIRYLTGSDKTQIFKREIIILIRLEILPPLKERIAAKKEDLIRKTILENDKYLKNLKSQQQKAYDEIEEDNLETFEEEE